MRYDTVLILDFGSQYTQLIGRVIRSFNVYCEIHPYNLSVDKIKEINPKAIILSGSPFSLDKANAPQPDYSMGNESSHIRYLLWDATHCFSFWRKNPESD